MSAPQDPEQPGTLDQLYQLLGQVTEFEQGLNTDGEQLRTQIEARSGELERQLADAEKVGDQPAAATAQSELDLLNEAHQTLTDTEEPDAPTEQQAGDERQPGERAGDDQPRGPDAGRPVAGDEPLS